MTYQKHTIKTSMILSRQQGLSTFYKRLLSYVRRFKRPIILSGFIFPLGVTAQADVLNELIIDKGALVPAAYSIYQTSAIDSHKPPLPIAQFSSQPKESKSVVTKRISPSYDTKTLTVNPSHPSLKTSIHPIATFQASSYQPPVITIPAEVTVKNKVRVKQVGLPLANGVPKPQSRKMSFGTQSYFPNSVPTADSTAPTSITVRVPNTAFSNPTVSNTVFSNTTPATNNINNNNNNALKTQSTALTPKPQTLSSLIASKITVAKTDQWRANPAYSSTQTPKSYTRSALFNSAPSDFYQSYFNAPNIDAAHINLLYQAEQTASKAGQNILKTLRQMALEDRELVAGSCWDYLNAAFVRAGIERETTFKGEYPYGPFINTASLQAGDWLYYVNHGYNDGEHSGVFVGWTDKASHQALILSYAGEGRQEPARYRIYDISHVYNVMRPI